MARMTVDPCMFCGSVPCTCIAAKPKAKPIKAAKPEAAKPDVPLEPKKFVMKALPTVAAPEPPPARTALQQTSKVQEIAAEDAELGRALYVLCMGGLMCADDIEKYKEIMSIPQERLRVLIWKQRRLEWQLSMAEKRT
jgi:hypothetical protein